VFLLKEKWLRLFTIAFLLFVTVSAIDSCGNIHSEDRYSAKPKTSIPQKHQLANHESPYATRLATNPVYYRDKVIVLMYHNVEVRSNHERIITVNMLDEHLTSLKKNRFQMISMDQYIDFLLYEKPIPDNAVLLTFDDGYETFYTNVFPLLRKHGVTATNFIVVSSIENQSYIGRKKLSWNQMREMKKKGMSFYNHTYGSHAYALVDREGKRRPKPLLSHRIYLKNFNRMETKQEYEKRIYYDLSRAEIRLRGELGNWRSVLAFPYGAYSRTSLRIAHELGIKVTFTVRRGINTHKMHNGFRINAGSRSLKTGDLIQMLKNGGK
jgi:biofilm PGA synthesis lipoprotein PgaB